MNKTTDNGMQNIDPKALFRIGYGLYLLTAKGQGRENGCIVNAVMQVTSTPNRVAVALNKSSFTHELVAQSGAMNVSCLSVDAPFSVFERFGLQSGRDTDKFAGVSTTRTENGLLALAEYTNAILSLQVESTTDLGTHTLFICSLTAAEVRSDKPTMTYDYYQKEVKPKPAEAKKKGYVCRVCGWVYEGDPLPEDIVCPICKHGASDFEPLK